MLWLETREGGAALSNFGRQIIVYELISSALLAHYIRVKKYCVIGYPVKHSLSPRLFNAIFKKAKLPARYEFAEVSPANLGNFMCDFRANFAGANVTIPHKKAIIKYLDKLSPEARKIGAVNVIVNRGGKLIGHNTDVFGAMAALKRGGNFGKFLKDKRAVVLGAGGAARAVVYGLKKAGAKVTILNRTLAHAKKLARDFDCEFGNLSLRVVMSLRAHSLRSVQAPRSNLLCDILINTTSVGIIGGKIKGQRSKIKSAGQKLKAEIDSPLPELKKILLTMNPKHLPVVMDIVYTPRMTKLLRDAKSAGCKIITGDKMFLAQAAKSFELWIGKDV